jgi:CubicO group peptidase (beta-lactamase class C family)
VKLSHRPTWSERGDGGGYAAGLNWQMLQSSGARTIWQSGDIAGYHSLCAVYPELKMGIVVLTNQDDRAAAARVAAVANEIARALDSRATAIP